MNSRVHPKYKTKYHVTNWSEYERGLVQRGDVTVWLSRDAIAAWKATQNGRRGGQLKYSDLAIETALSLRLVFHLPLRQTEGLALVHEASVRTPLQALLRTISATCSWAPSHSKDELPRAPEVQDEVQRVELARVRARLGTAR